MKNARDLEKYFKGVANHRRIDILHLVSRLPNITVEGIAEKLECDFQVIAVHAQKLSRVGLINKKNVGRSVGHIISPHGKKFLSFIESL